MATELNVTCVDRDADGKITHIGSKGWTHTFVNAIYNIENNLFHYKINGRTKIVITQDAINGKYLRSEHKEHPEDNIDNLHGCHIYGQ